MMEELAASPSFTYPSIHPPCEVEFTLRRRLRHNRNSNGINGDHDEDSFDDDDVSSNMNYDDDSPLSSPPNSPYRLNDHHHNHSPVQLMTTTVQKTTTPSATAATVPKEPAPFDETPLSTPQQQQQIQALQLDLFPRPELILPNNNMATTAQEQRRSSSSYSHTSSAEDSNFLKTEPPKLRLRHLSHSNLKSNQLEAMSSSFPSMRARNSRHAIAQQQQQHNNNNNHQSQSLSKMLPFEDEEGAQEQREHRFDVWLLDNAEEKERPEGPHDEKDHQRIRMDAPYDADDNHYDVDDIEVVMAPTDEGREIKHTTTGASSTSNNNVHSSYQHHHHHTQNNNNHAPLEDVSSLDGDGACVIRHSKNWSTNGSAGTTQKNKKHPSPSPTTTTTVEGDATETEEEDQQEPPSLVVSSTSSNNPLRMLRQRVVDAMAPSTTATRSMSMLASSSTLSHNNSIMSSSPLPREVAGGAGTSSGCGEKKRTTTTRSRSPAGMLFMGEQPSTRSMYCQVEVSPRVVGPSSTLHYHHDHAQGGDDDNNRKNNATTATTTPPLQPYYRETNETRASYDDDEKDDDDIPLIPSGEIRAAIQAVQKACRNSNARGSGTSATTSSRRSNSSNRSDSGNGRRGNTTAAFNPSISMPLLDHNTAKSCSSKSSPPTVITVANVVTPQFQDDNNDNDDNAGRQGGGGADPPMILTTAASWDPCLDRFGNPTPTRRPTAAAATATASSSSNSSSRGGAAVSPEKLSIVGIATPPAVKRLNESFESIVVVSEEDGGGVRHRRRHTDPAVSPVRALAGSASTSNQNLSVDSESTASLIESLDAMVRDIEVDALKAPSHSNPSTPRQDRRNQADKVSQKHQSPTTSLGSFLVGTPQRPNDHFVSDSDSLSEAAKPVLVKPLDSEIGIPKGDIMLSLPNSASVEEAVWRCRTMRRNCDTRWLKEKAYRKPGLPSKGRTSIQVDLDNGRVSGGIQSLSVIQNAAIEHIKYDDFDDALSLYDDILQSYDAFFEQEFKQSVNKAPAHRQQDVKNYKLFLGMALHNIGTITLLKGEYQKAFTYFERATLNRASNPGVGHPDHIASLVKMALCHFALEDFTSAQAELEEALGYLRGKKTSMADHRQHAEVLNNLGCLSYMCGQTASAIVLLEESLDQQAYIADQSLYAGSRFSCHNGTLNASITKVNLGLLALSTGDATVAITAFEAALRDQQLLLRDAHATLLATVEYLVIANLVSGKKEKALQLLRRMLHMQIDAFGPVDPRCLATGEKITSLQTHDAKDSPTTMMKANDSNVIPSAIEVPEAPQTKGKFRPFTLMRRR